MFIQLLIIYLFFPAIVSLASKASHENEPFNLINNGSRTHFWIDYRVQDQCSSKELSQVNINSFALKFQLLERCDQGLLICYPSVLDKKNSTFGYGLEPGVQFRVPNVENNVTAACQEKQNKSGNLQGPVWHGIRVHTYKRKEPWVLGKRSLQLELSITRQKFGFQTKRTEFSILFGTRESLATTFVDKDGYEIETSNNDTALRDAFLNRSSEGVGLAKYVGLWTLGMDLLPVHNQQKVQLHVYRECGCELHAWNLHSIVTELDQSEQHSQLSELRHIVADQWHAGTRKYLPLRLNLWFPGGHTYFSCSKDPFLSVEIVQFDFAPPNHVLDALFRDEVFNVNDGGWTPSFVTELYTSSSA